MLGAVAVTTLELTKQIQQLPAQQRVQAICSVGLERSAEKDSDNADTEHVWSELCCGPFHEAAAAPSCDTVSLTVRLTVRLTVKLASCFPNNAGLLPALTEAPWKEFGTGESGATDPK